MLFWLHPYWWTYRWRTFKCWLRHGPHWTAEPIYHSYLMSCTKCGRKWVEHD